MTAVRKPGGEVSEIARAAMIAAVACGRSQEAVASAFGVTRSVVQREIQHFESSATLESKPRSGRRPVLTPQEKRYIIQTTRRKPQLTNAMLANTLDTPIFPVPHYAGSFVSRKQVKSVLRGGFRCQRR